MCDYQDVLKAVALLRSALKNNTIHTLSASDFRVFIHYQRQDTEIPNEILQAAAEDLLLILSSSHLCNDSQIVVATAYSSTITYLKQDSDKIFQHFVHLLGQDRDVEIKIYLSHAVLQLNNNHWIKPGESKSHLVQEIFKVAKSLCYELTSVCVLAFKVLNSLLCKIHLMYQDRRGISTEMFITTLNIVMSNWENPLAGVRQQNSMVLNQLLIFEEEILKAVLPKSDGYDLARDCIRHQGLLELTFIQLSWTMKSKYFILTAVLKQSNIVQILENYGTDLVEGITFSLSMPHLVSAGTELYRTILAALSFSEWHQYFLAPFHDVINDSNFSLAMENIFDYWMQHTVKKFPMALDVLLEDTSSLNQYSFITLFKLVRKEGLPISDWELMAKTTIKFALDNYSYKVRSQAFCLICTSSKTSVMPKDEEFCIVQNFLRQNINSDNTAFRQNILNSFTIFIIHIRDSLLYIIKNKNFDITAYIQCFSFLDWLHSFLLFNLEDRCNYQRKITSLELYKIVLTYLGEPPGKNEKYYSRKSNKGHLSLKAYEKRFSYEYKFESQSSQKTLLNCLFDEDKDVRLSSASILTSYFKTSDSNIEELESIFQAGLDLCSNQVFYKAESGALVIQVLVSLASNSSSKKLREIVYNGNGIFTSILASAEEQFKRLQEDLLRGASEGSFLYGTLQALELLLNDNTTPELLMLEDHQLKKLIVLVEKITEYFIAVLSSKSDPNSVHAASFGEMGMAIASVVENSSLKNAEVVLAAADDSLAGDLQLTPAQQLVLSCVWLNLKECCKLCSILVNKPLGVADTQRCVTLVVSVLRKCRHKGAIESAGLALHTITRHLTSSCDLELVALPAQLMESFLQCVVGTTSTTVSRRSAGLAILVHKLITGDSRPGKPLLHLCVSKLVPIAGEPVSANEGTLMDLPQSQALHFLRTLVQESSLREHMAQYTSSVSLLALTNLASPVWTVRNAALQLFGALVPKLVGQKPHQDEGRGDHHLAFEELYMHAKPLVKIMLSEFSSAARSNSMVLHSKLMPLLTLVTNLTVGLHAVISVEVSKIVDDFQKDFQSLFKSNIFNVRKLSAKAHSLFLTSSELAPMIEQRVKDVLPSIVNGKEHCILSENELHGYLLNIKYLFERFKEENVGMKVLQIKEEGLGKLLINLANIVLSGNNSYFVKALIFEIKLSTQFGDNLVIPHINTSALSLGFPHFVNKQLISMLLNTSEEKINEIVEFYLLKNSNHDTQLSCLKALQNLLKSESKQTNRLISSAPQTLYVIQKEFLLQDNHSTECLIIALENIVYLLDKLVNILPGKLLDKLFCPKFLSYGLDLLYSKLISDSVFNLVLPLVCAMVSAEGAKDLNNLDMLAAMINDRSKPNVDQEVRAHAAKSLTFLVQAFKYNKIRETTASVLIWKACIHFLQDEITEVRYEASRFVTTLLSHQKNIVWNPYLSLECLFQYSTIKQLMLPEQALDCLWEQMTCRSMEEKNEKGILNPYDHGAKNIYAEETVVSCLAYYSILGLLEGHKASKLALKAKQMCIALPKDKFSSPKTIMYIQEIEERLVGIPSVTYR